MYFEFSYLMNNCTFYLNWLYSFLHAIYNIEISLIGIE